MWDEITYPFPNFNGCTIEVWAWISNFIPHFIMGVITYPFWVMCPHWPVWRGAGAVFLGLLGLGSIGLGHFPLAWWWWAMPERQESPPSDTCSCESCAEVHSLACGRSEWNFRWLIFKQTLVIDGWGSFHEIALRWIMSLDLTDGKSALVTMVQVMAWCHQATSHYLSQSMLTQIYVSI